MGIQQSTHEGGGGGGKTEQQQPNFYFHRNDAFVMMTREEEAAGGGGAGEEVYSQEFHNTVRESIIFMLFFLTLLGMASMLIDFVSVSSTSCSSTPAKRSPRTSGGGGTTHHHQQQHEHSSNSAGGDDDKSVVKRICSWLCTLTLSTSIGATLLLPISIVSNEILLLYPTNSYLEWLNGMLIQGLWNLVFLFSNIGLFILLPFAHLFIEAEGFSGTKRGLVSKLQETVVVLTLLSLIVWGISLVVNSLFANSSVLFHFNQLPFIYSCISFIGVLVLTLCTPLGVSHLFTVLSANFVFVPEFLRNLEEEHTMAVLELENLRNQRTKAQKNHNNAAFGSTVTLRANKDKTQQQLLPNGVEMDDAIDSKRRQIAQLESHMSTPPWKRNGLYPSLFVGVLVVTGFTVFIVMINAVKIVAGFRDLSLELVAKETLPLGRSSLSFLGPGGAVFEIILVMYLTTSSLIGLYNLPGLRSVAPVKNNTPTSHLISNCAIGLVLSSALPVFMRILGLTNFDLLGTYAGKIDWLENTVIVVCVNLLFTVLTCVILINKATRKISTEVVSALRHFFYKD